ncbi:DUF192 domain-containing protein [Pararoseomonas indoligenes]|uniref:DUF192 domain-containing protein n=1 Tax=Roseomonas indoligenes TaxID=2820811 RepID=A0A940MYT0_9PROT|nr:DUF192 domain-containing protein [Pararoseomonas indoligenes]MBP0492931.1 DUF192 domain-containing protein [Pararoseomonas indoligenes]
MNRRSLLGLALAGALASGGALAQEGPQPKLPTEPLVIVTHDGKRHEFQVEMALAPDQQMVGLMFRPSVAPTEGMLFDWGQPRESTMWMRNTITSLDMLFITANGTVLRIAERTVPRSLATISSNGPVRATLELAAGTAERLGIRVGDKVEQRIFGTAR